MLLKTHNTTSLLTLFLFSTLLIGCFHDSSNIEKQYCDNPAPLNGKKDPDAPGYIVAFKDDISTVDEVTRLQGIYDLEVYFVYESALHGFSGNMDDDAREQLRCENSIVSITYNAVATTTQNLVLQ